jgi:GNAT superfamily N-acetyltransferase
MLIRKAEVEDSTAIASVEVACERALFEEAGANPDASEMFGFTRDPSDEFNKLPIFEKLTIHWQRLISTDEDYRFIYVAVNDAAEIVGVAVGLRLLARRSLQDSMLSTVDVLPAYRHQGIGRQLILVTALRLRQEGGTSLYLHTMLRDPARRMFERLGGTLMEEMINSHSTEEKRIEFFESIYAWSDINQLIDACQQCFIR